MRPLWPDWLSSFAAGPRRPQLVCGWLSHPLLAGAPAPPASTTAPSHSSPLRPTSQVHLVPHLHAPPCPTKSAWEDRVFRSVPRSHLPGGSLGSFLLLLVRVKRALATWPGWRFRLAAVRTVGFRTQRPPKTMGSRDLWVTGCLDDVGKGLCSLTHFSLFFFRKRCLATSAQSWCRRLS